MTRAGGIKVRRERHRGLAEREVVFEPPAHAYCFSCRRQVSMIWVKAVRHSDGQPRPSYRGNCVRCLAMVGTPWQRTRLVVVKAKTLEKLVEGAKQAEDALYERRMEVADRRRREDAELRARREQRRFRDAIDAAEATVQGRLMKSDARCDQRRHPIHEAPAGIRQGSSHFERKDLNLWAGIFQ